MEIFEKQLLKLHQEKKNIRPICFIPQTKDDDENLDSDDEDDKNKVPIFPKTKLFAEAFLKHQKKGTNLLKLEKK